MYMTRKVATAVRRVFNKVRIFKIRNKKLSDQFIINFLTPEHERMHPLISYHDTESRAEFDCALTILMVTCSISLNFFFRNPIAFARV